MANAAVPAEGSAAALPEPLTLYVPTDVMNAMEEYARADTSREQGGILFGQYYSGPSGGVTIVSGWTEAEYTESTGASVTFTHETWASVHEVRERDFPHSRIIGWFHTHPNFGVFLSNYDVFLHKTLFEFPGAVALVADPVRNQRGGFFVLPGGEMGQCQLSVVGDVTTIRPLTAPAPPPRGRLGIVTLVFGVVLVAATVMTWRVTAASGEAQVARLAEQVGLLTNERDQLMARPKEATSPAAQPAPPPTTETVAYVVVQPGDTLSGISLAVYGTARDWPKLAQANRLSEPWTINPGQLLLVPDLPLP